MTYTNRLRWLYNTNTECICTRFNGNPTCRFTYRCLSENSTCSQQAASHFPTAPPPDPGGHFSHFERHFPGRSGLCGLLSITHSLTWLFQLLSASTAEARWSSVRPARRTNPTATTAHYCLTGSSHCKQGWALTASPVKEATCCSLEKKDSDFMLEDVCFFH